MFGNSYFGPRYFGDRYFGQGLAAAVVVTPDESTAGGGGGGSTTGTQRRSLVINVGRPAVRQGASVLIVAYGRMQANAVVRYASQVAADAPTAFYAAANVLWERRTEAVGEGFMNDVRSRAIVAVTSLQDWRKTEEEDLFILGLEI